MEKKTNYKSSEQQDITTVMLYNEFVQNLKQIEVILKWMDKSYSYDYKKDVIDKISQNFSNFVKSSKEIMRLIQDNKIRLIFDETEENND